MCVIVKWGNIKHKQKLGWHCKYVLTIKKDLYKVDMKTVELCRGDESWCKQNSLFQLQKVYLL